MRKESWKFKIGRVLTGESISHFNDEDKLY